MERSKGDPKQSGGPNPTRVSDYGGQQMGGGHEQRDRSEGAGILPAGLGYRDAAFCRVELAAPHDLDAPRIDEVEMGLIGVP